MIKKCSVVIAKDNNPHRNLAIEQCLLNQVKDTECILYLWQNESTVVIGKNQNAYKECHIDKMKEDGCILARRASGGGAVYQDLGNLNFTFIAYKENYDVSKQMSVILKALISLGIHAEASGRNDICVNHKKISGNAFSHTQEKSCHHGTLLVHVDLAAMNKYLNPSLLKLQSKGVSSVKSRVANLIDYYPDLSVTLLKDRIIEAFQEVYENEITYLDMDEDNDDVKKEYLKYSHSQYLFKTQFPFEIKRSNRFTWGEIDFYLHVNEGKIKHYEIYCDSIKLDFIENLKTCLLDCEFLVNEMIKKIEMIKCFDEEKHMQMDIIDWLKKEWV